ncbi:MAG: NBR1-Ig-like domain-containing protein [Chloroflexota bacterium]
MPDLPFYLLLPMDWSYQISSRFNSPRRYAFAPQRLQLHEGIDFAPRHSSTQPLYVRASQRGIVDKVGFDARGYGNYVRVLHDWGGDRFVSWYGHMKEVHTHENDYVNIGDRLGIAGSTGNSTGTHIHLTLQHIGRGLKNYVVDDVVDPEPFLRGAVAPLDEAWWLGDLTIADGSAINAGTSFRKTWRIRNVGTTTWRPGYQLAFFSGSQMNGPASVPLPPAKPGEAVDVSVDLIAPDALGIQRSTWKPRNAENKFFDFAQYVEIDVKASQTRGVSEARFVEDVTVPHATNMKPGQPFRKIWRIRNTGSVAWGDGYQFVFVADDPMGAPAIVPLPLTLPGQETEISVSMVAPMKPGAVRSTWRPRDPQGNFFEFPMRVEILVIPSGQVDDALAVSDVIILKPGQPFVKTWRIMNNGQTRWGEGYQFVYLGGDLMGAPMAIPVPSSKPQVSADLSITFIAPATPGSYMTHWELRNPNGQGFGPVFDAKIEVRA